MLGMRHYLLEHLQLLADDVGCQGRGAGNVLPGWASEATSPEPTPAITIGIVPAAACAASDACVTAATITSTLID